MSRPLDDFTRALLEKANRAGKQQPVLGAKTAEAMERVAHRSGEHRRATAERHAKLRDDGMLGGQRLPLIEEVSR